MPRGPILQFCALYLAFSLVSSVLSANITLYYSTIGSSNTQIGLAVSVTTFVAVFGQFLWGYVADAIGNKRVFIGCMTVMLVCSALFFSGIVPFPIVLFSGLIGLFFSAMLTIVDVWVLKSVRLGGSFDFAFIRSWSSFGVASFSLFYCLLLDKIGTEVSLVFAVVAIAIAIIVAARIRIEPLEVALDTNKTKVGIKSIGKLFADKRYVLAVLAFALSCIPMYSEYFMIQIRIKQSGGAAVISGICITAIMFSQWFTMIIYRKIAARFNVVTIFLGGISLYAIYYLCQSFATSPLAIALTAGLTGLAFGTMLPSLRQIIFKSSPQDVRTLAQSLTDALSLGFCASIGGIIGGKFIDINNGQTLMYICFAIALVSVVPAFILWRKHRGEFE